MKESVRNYPQNVVLIQRMCGRAYAVSRRGDRVVVRYMQRREHKCPALRGVVVRFPVR